MLSFPNATVTITILGATAEDLRLVMSELLTPMEDRLMTTQEEAFNTLGAKADAQNAAIIDLTNDFVAFRDAMATETLSPAGQAAFDAASAKADAASATLATLDAMVGDADGSDTPPPPPAP